MRRDPQWNRRVMKCCRRIAGQEFGDGRKRNNTVIAIVTNQPLLTTTRHSQMSRCAVSKQVFTENNSRNEKSMPVKCLCALWCEYIIQLLQCDTKRRLFNKLDLFLKA